MSLPGRQREIIEKLIWREICFLGARVDSGISCIRISFKYEDKWNSYLCHNPNEPWEHECKGKQPVIKGQISFHFTYMRCPEKWNHAHRKSINVCHEMGAGEWGVAAKGGWNIFIGMMKMFRNLIIVMNVQFFGHIKNQSCILLEDCATWYVNYISINLKKWFIIVYRHHTKKIIRYMLLNFKD